MSWNARLCYVEDSFAFFTTREPFTDQWGDDWNDAPYEHNAGRPYQYRPYNAERGEAPWEIVQIAYEADLETPRYGEDNQHPEFGSGNSRWTVQDINGGAVPWLRSWYPSQPHIAINAGCTVAAFIELIEAAGGTVYMNREAVPA